MFSLNQAEKLLSENQKKLFFKKKNLDIYSHLESFIWHFKEKQRESKSRRVDDV